MTKLKSIMPFNLDKAAAEKDTEMIMDNENKTIYDPRYFSTFQQIKYQKNFGKVRPDLSAEDSYEWTRKFEIAEETLDKMLLIIMKKINLFKIRFRDRYTNMADEATDQLNKINLTSLMRDNMTRSGNFEEIQLKVNWYDKIMDKVNGYELLYPIKEQSLEVQAQKDSITVKERQEALKNKFLREMGVDYSILK